MAVPGVEILIVEGNPADADLIFIALRKNNLANRVCHVKDGEEALNYLFCSGSYADRDSNEKPKLILLDLNLSKVHGIEVLRSIKNDEKTAHVPVVILTSSHRGQDLAECYQLGANGYIVKPKEFDDFIRAVSAVSRYWVLFNNPLS